jgi:transposase
MLEQFHKFLQSLGPAQIPPPKTILIFDKGNNSLANFTLLDRLGLSFVGSVKLDEHPELAQVSQEDRRWQNCTTERLESTKAFALRRQVYGKERTVVVTFNQNLFDTQLATVQADLTKALSKLKTLQSRLSDRASGQIKRGSAPTNASIGKQCTAICARPYLDRLVVWEISSDAAHALVLTYRLDEAAMQQVQQTLLGKTILITDQTQWSCEQVIQAYRSQFVIEDIFKGMKDRKLGSWWPLYHWTDPKIRAHGFYCTVAVLLRSLLWRRVRTAGIPVSAQQLWSELARIREVVNVYGTETQPSTQRILSRGSELQQALIRLLNLKVQPETEESAASHLKAEN